MSQDDSSFIREVNEELRSDAAKAFWRRWRFYIAGLATLIVVATAAERGWQYWRGVTAARSGDQFLVALELAREGKTNDALAAFKTLEDEGHGSYPELARMRAATVIADGGDKQAAADQFLIVANDSSVSQALRDVARLRAGYLLVDTAGYSDVSAAVEVLAVPENGLRHSAREALGLSAFKAGDYATARAWFDEIAGDAQAPAGITRRAGVMLDLIASRAAAN